MSGRGSAARVDAAPPRDLHVELRKASQALEGVFLAQLMKAMRESVPDSGLLDEDPGRDMFQSLLDERLALVAAERMKGGVGETLCRQLERRFTPGRTSAAPAPAASAAAAPGSAPTARPRGLRAGPGAVR